MPPIIVHQSKQYYQDIQFDIPLDWTFHHTTSGYMDRYGWIKSMTQFSNICVAYPFNNQILFFDAHDSHFDDGALRQNMCKKFQRVVLISRNMLFYPCVVRKANAHLDKKALNLHHQAQKGFHGIFVGITQHIKGYLVYVLGTRRIISSCDVVFDTKFSSTLAYTSQPYT